MVKDPKVSACHFILRHQDSCCMDVVGRQRTPKVGAQLTPHTNYPSDCTLEM